MKRSYRSLVPLRPASPRRGVTLVEMLVTVAVLVIMMTILVQIFQAATGSVTAAQALQQLDDQLRRIDGIIRADLEGVTARFTPPLDPAQNLGYFEYGENEFADIQGEDSDDYIRFTAKAPEGRPFTGRMWVNPQSNAYNGAVMPITVTSEYAEIIYFLRNGNLYRRVLLVAPQLQSAVAPAINNVCYYTNTNGQQHFQFMPNALGGVPVSWQAVNDLSARPSSTGPNPNAGTTAQAQAPQTIVLNTLGDLTNRERRFAYPRNATDFATNPNGYPASGGPDGIPDDVNGDNIPDLYQSLYPGAFNPTNAAGALIFAPPFAANVSGGQPTGDTMLQNNPGFGLLAFPYVFPGAYSNPQYVSHDQYGWIHSPTPLAIDESGNQYQFDKNPIQYLQYMNHNPLDLGDNLPVPPTGNLQVGGGKSVSDLQTWWGFPTWRETLSPLWNDPTVQVSGNSALNIASGQPNGLTPRSASIVPVANDINLLPAMTASTSGGWRRNAQLFTDGWGSNNQFFASNSPLWVQYSWEDDLIMTGVRSFDVKAYDNALANYADLGWGDDWRVTGNTNLPAPYLTGTYDMLTQTYGIPANIFVNNQYYDLIGQTFAHEGRMPPIYNDWRLDAQFGATSYSGFNYNGNVGDDNPGVVRMRRVWDSWSTDYSRAPATGVNTANGGFPAGPPFSPPVYPSYPPPYPAPLRGIQIQIRVADPTNQRIKSLTIRQDFTDKL